MEKIIEKLNESLMLRLCEFESKHGHEATICLHSDGSGAIQDLWGNEEDFKNVFEYLLD